MANYRIRWARRKTKHGTNRLCIAERRKWFLFIPYWVSIAGADCWHASERLALGDIERDKFIQSPLPKTAYVL